MHTEPAKLLDSTVFTIDSKSTGRTYQITVSLPFGYVKPADGGFPFEDAPEKWNTIYVLDGNMVASMVTSMVRPMAWCGSETRDAIVVGIGLALDNGAVEVFREWFTRRCADLTPIRDEADERVFEELYKRPAPSGDAANFLTFIKDELIPIIEQDYRVDSEKRILAGHSYGGLFAAYTLFEAPNLFETFIIGSPSLYYGDRFIFKQEEDFAKDHQTLPANVLMYIGDEESADTPQLTNALRFATILESRNYAGFTLKKKLFMDDNHCQVIVPGFYWALKHALKKII